jgi:hypothetical protein
MYTLQIRVDFPRDSGFFKTRVEENRRWGAVQERLKSREISQKQTRYGARE